MSLCAILKQMIENTWNAITCSSSYNKYRIINSLFTTIHSQSYLQFMASSVKWKWESYNQISRYFNMLQIQWNYNTQSMWCYHRVTMTTTAYCHDNIECHHGYLTHNNQLRLKYLISKNNKLHDVYLTHFYSKMLYKMEISQKLECL